MMAGSKAICIYLYSRMNKYWIFVTFLLSSCVYDAYNDQVMTIKEHVVNEVLPISFSRFTKRTTRSNITGEEAASLLNNRFVVMGTKGNEDIAQTSVFDNYTVEYIANTANTTATNTANWEYVGVIPDPTISSVSSQMVKYWDYGAHHYDFIAYSGGTNVTSINSATASSPEAGGAYSFEGTAMVADMVTVMPEDYGKQVNIVFKSSDAKIRIALYETIPGYNVKDVRFYSSMTAGMSDYGVKLVSSADNVICDAKCVAYYPTVGKPGNLDNNVVHVVPVTGTGTVSNIVPLGNLSYSSSGYLGTSSSDATYSDVKSVVPNEGHSASLTLRIDYTLESVDGSGEKIKVYGAKAVVPSVYCDWKLNHSYTYLFKISNSTNGKTDIGGDVEGLTAITFDAVVESSIEGWQETVTTVANPSETTLVGKEETEEETHEFVDLGLSVKWATCNVGATSPEEYGSYFAWGETEGGKASYSWATYKYCDGTATSMNKYCLSASKGVVDGLSTLDKNDDAAHKLWGGNWRTPTIDELKELYNNCTFSWTDNYNGTGISGAVMTSKKIGYTDKYIFLPASGYYSNTSVTIGQSGWYWANSISSADQSDNANCFFFFSWASFASVNRYNGANIRAVHD